MTGHYNILSYDIISYDKRQNGNIHMYNIIIYVDIDIMEG